MYCEILTDSKKTLGLSLYIFRIEFRVNLYQRLQMYIRTCWRKLMALKNNLLTWNASEKKKLSVSSIFLQWCICPQCVNLFLALVCLVIFHLSPPVKNKRLYFGKGLFRALHTQFTRTLGIQWVHTLPERCPLNDLCLARGHPEHKAVSCRTIYSWHLCQILQGYPNGRIIEHLWFRTTIS